MPNPRAPRRGLHVRSGGRTNEIVDCCANRLDRLRRAGVEPGRSRPSLLSPSKCFSLLGRRKGDDEKGTTKRGQTHLS
jgi:hypothetical protein